VHSRCIAGGDGGKIVRAVAAGQGQQEPLMCVVLELMRAPASSRAIPDSAHPAKCGPSSGRYWRARGPGGEEGQGSREGSGNALTPNHRGSKKELV
jgi:hypothetical protein